MEKLSNEEVVETAHSEKVFYVYKIIFLKGTPKYRYYIGKHCSKDMNDTYVGSGNFCKFYYNEYGCQEGVTYLKEILDISYSEQENREKETLYIGTLYKDDPLCMNEIKGGVSRVKKVKRKIHQYDLYGSLCNIYESITEASRAVGVNAGDICSCCKGVRQTAGGYMWQYSTDNREVEINNVSQWTLLGEYLTMFPTLGSAAKSVNGHQSAIKKCCDRLSKTSYGYIWRYKGDSVTDEDLQKIKFVEQYNPQGKLLGVFPTVKQAAKVNKIPKWKVWNSIYEDREVEGYKWKYEECKGISKIV